MTPFVLEGEQVATEWARFTSEAAKWKPSGYDAEMALRLRYYLDQQLEDTREELRRRFPETWEKMAPVTLSVTKHLIREKAKVFLSTTKLDLVQDGEPLPGEAGADGETKPHPLVSVWERAKERMGLALRLKRVDTYTQLMRTCFLRIGHSPGRFTAHVVFPHMVRVVMDPAAPMDLDRAFGVAVEIASDAGLSSGARRWEFWCAREGEERHLVVEEVVDEKGKTLASIVTKDEAPPLLGPEGRAVVPLVPFAAHTEELGLFTMEGSDLIPLNRGMNVLATDIVHIAEQQGFGVMVITTPAGGGDPGKIVRSPNTAIALKDGTKAEFINANAPLADLVELVKTRLQLAATLDGIPPGSVSLDARAAASGVQLQIEMRPLTEARQDQVDTYRESMRRVWEVFWAVYTAAAEEANGPAERFGSDVELRWTPGDMQVPTDDSTKVDNTLARLKSGLISRIEAIAADRGVSVEEAREIAKRIDAEDGQAPAAEDGAPVLDLGAKKAQLAGGPPAPAAQPGNNTAAAVEGVVQDTALNGSQVSSLLEIIQAAADRDLPMESAQALVEAAFPAIPPALIARIMSALKKFQPAKPDPAPPPFPPKPVQPPPPPAE